MKPIHTSCGLLVLLCSITTFAVADSQVISFSGDAPSPRKSVVTSGNNRYMPAGCRFEREVLSGGKQDGVELITLDNGRLRITVIPTRGLSVLRVDDLLHPGFKLGWDSPVKQVVHPKYIDLESRGGLGWLEGFNEWMVRCGLEFAGHPGLDEFTTNTGDTAKMTLSLHGKIGNIPAHHVTATVDTQGDRTQLTVQGEVAEHMFYGPKLTLSTKLVTEPNADWFSIEDTVKNVGGTDQEFQLIYHANYGAPLLEAGAQILVPFKSLTPMNDNAAKHLNSYATYKAPTTSFVEEVFLVEPLAAKGRSLAVLKNAKGDQATSLRWQVDQLPYLTIWKNTAATADGYVTGIEPATGYPFNRKVERKAGRLPKLKPQESRRFALTFQVHFGAEAISTLEKEVQTIQGDRPRNLVPEPPKVD